MLKQLKQWFDIKRGKICPQHLAPVYFGYGRSRCSVTKQNVKWETEKPLTYKQVMEIAKQR